MGELLTWKCAKSVMFQAQLFHVGDTYVVAPDGVQPPKGHFVLHQPTAAAMQPSAAAGTPVPVVEKKAALPVRKRGARK